VWRKEIPDYIHYYNHERPHQGIDWLTPVEKLAQCCEAID
ncbi:integrase core domain-containing protein, partial [Candidatus Saccharibacteria bacterium]|nr:integrase core domain-containing protein [Candidatus Saccharibacteria bacterium]MBP9813518.1 integrase core domain-containing protein [Candidatus Saccharibacteria bacterium]